MHIWKKLTTNQIKEHVFSALQKNVDYNERTILGVPASHLDEKVFNRDMAFLNDAPFLSSMVYNPNHIGCHTMGESEAFFAGTQEIEKELIEIVAVDILKSKPHQCDGYVASGGTEANMQAMWIYRNYFIKEHKAKHHEIAILCSDDSHYSMPKAANILNIPLISAKVDDNTRVVDEVALQQQMNEAKRNEIKHVVVIANMMTTMFGSVDHLTTYTDVLKKLDIDYKVHVDGAYGGFVYPFSAENPDLLLDNPEITSVTLDAHKMVQAPFGTGIFIIRKGWMQYATTEEAQYVQGMDATVIGSRSGANAISIWMILMTYGPHGWFEKIHLLNYRTTWLCTKLDELGVDYYRHPASNLVTMRASFIPEDIAHKYGIVPDTHDGEAQWYKIVVMSHVTVDHLLPFIEDLQEALKS
ncbi:aminotransferase class I/II-fold pyridoxal phosphate-dependent enzyme [Halosquirtibacter xylanolyticus]|uniref:pyridoxal phosphate-dependent decarboxylase family protein n=1 Tax=Halosquirtibacter xylanolyticus TaxID=3374599 RepID=UPI00374A6B44|nr:aminotransferase class I/II-fold pyridoxal phosphate-dependent enzyme [Prolixibacteraceae bacterium]